MTESSPTLFCENHPDVPTSLRCNSCEKLICPKCAVLTPTGYRCKECISNQQKRFDTAEWYDYILAFIVGTIVSFVGGLLVNVLVRLLGFFIILLFLFVGASAGVIIAEAIRYVTRKRRSKRLFQIAAASVVVGFLPIIFYDLLISNYWGVLWVGLYALTSASAVYARLRGLRM